jgi:hypothetical protein
LEAIRQYAEHPRGGIQGKGFEAKPDVRSEAISQILKDAFASLVKEQALLGETLVTVQNGRVVELPAATVLAELPPLAPKG